jgi:hypothetical protein
LEAELRKILDEAVKQLKAKGWGTSSAYAIGTSALQKSGSLKKGHNTPTKKGIKRGNMTRAERHRIAP